MSRSYKHTPRCGERKDRAMKTYANRKLRRQKNDYFLQHKSYKKNFCSYDICDYEEVGTTFEDYWKTCLRVWYIWHFRFPNDPYPDRNEEYRRWLKWYKRK